MSAREIAKRALPSRRALFSSIAFGVLSQGAAVALLATSAWLITRTAEQPPILYVTFAVVAVRAFAISRAVFRYLERVVSHESAFRALAELRVWIYRRLVPLAPAGLQHASRGSVLSTVVRDVDTLQDYPLRVVQPVASALIVVSLSVVALGAVDIQASIALALLLAVAGTLSVWWNQHLSAAAERQVAPVRAQMADALIDTLQRRAVLVAYGAEATWTKRIVGIDRTLEAVERRVAMGQQIAQGILVVLSGSAVAVMAWVALPRVASGDLSGPLFALLVLAPLAVFDVFQAIPSAVSAWRGVDASASRISTLVPETIPAGIPLEREDDPDPDERIEAVSTLVISEFQAKWPDRANYPSAPLNVELVAGDRLLITGESGVGKSTLANALVGFLDYRGSVRFDGVEARDMPLRLLRRKVALIEQRPHLFDQSLRHNLSFANPNASDEDLMAALSSVGLAEWVVERGGLDSPIGESGALVSGGQAQRIAVARAFLAKAPVIVLDEPTANVDRAIAEQLMQDLLTSIGREGPSIAIVISHVPVDQSLITAQRHLAPALD